jgi:hypothetical protein
MPACTPDKAKGGMTPHHIHGEMKYGEKRNEGRRTQGWGRTHGGDGGARHKAPGAVSDGVEVQRRPLGDKTVGWLVDTRQKDETVRWVVVDG